MMQNLLVPVDGSEYSARAVDYAITRVANSVKPVTPHLLTVQASLASVNIKLLVSRESLEDYYREEGEQILQPLLERLKLAEIVTIPHIGVGDVATTILRYAEEHSASEIIMGSHGRGAMTGVLMGSVAQKVVHGSTLPVVIVK